MEATGQLRHTMERKASQKIDFIILEAHYLLFIVHTLT